MTFLGKVFKKKDDFALKLERIVGFYPNNLSLYHQAFLHKSFVQHNKLKPFESNERLEFLGDAILDSIISHYFFNKFPFKDEGFLTQLRARVVSRQNLNNLGVKLGFKELINAKIDKESKSIYGDALEAIIGAIYLDKGYKYAQQFVEQKLLQTHIDLDEIINTETDFKSRVIEWCQKEKLNFDFKITEQESKQGVVYDAELIIDNEPRGKGTANSKKKAEQHASEQFYKTIS